MGERENENMAERIHTHETQVWLELAQKCHYLNRETEKRLDAVYDHIIGQLIRMIDEAEKWIVKPS